MKYFIDTEFIEYPNTIDLLSIGMVSEDSRELYLENSQADWSMASEWVKNNVISKLNPSRVIDIYSIKNQITDFCDVEKYGNPEFWGYYADYDWVVFCWIFGAMIDLPKGYPMYCKDIQQLADYLNIQELPNHEANEHNALDDAKWNKKAWEFLAKQ